METFALPLCNCMWYIVASVLDVLSFHKKMQHDRRPWRDPWFLAAGAAVSSLRPWGYTDSDKYWLGHHDKSNVDYARFIPQKDMAVARKRRRSKLRTPEPGVAGGSNWRGSQSQRTPQSLPRNNLASSFPGNNSVMPVNAVGRRRDARGRFVARRRVRRTRRVTFYRKKSFKKVSRKGRGKFSKRRGSSQRRLAKKVSFAKFGSIKAREDGGIVQDSQCVYIGHAIAFGQLYESICRAVIRELFRQKGENIVDWTDHWLGTSLHMVLAYKYGLPNATTLSTATVTFVQPASYSDLANLLLVSLKANLTTSIGYVIYDMWLGEAVDSSNTVALINFNQCMLNFYVKSELKVQNATHAADVDENDQYTDIHNRPVVGKVYYSKRQMAGFLPNSRVHRGATAEPSYESYLANYTSGIIAATNSTTLSFQTKKPPAGYYFNANTSYTKISPGQIRTYRWTYRKAFNGSTFLSKFSGQFTGAHGTAIKAVYPIGPAQMVGLEKEIDIRSANETDIVVGFQITQTYCCAITKRVPKAGKILDVTVYDPGLLPVLRTVPEVPEVPKDDEYDYNDMGFFPPEEAFTN